MSLKPQEDLGVPDETRRVAMAAFPKGCACLRIGDALGCVYQDKQFEALFPRRGQPAEAPGRLVPRRAVPTSRLSNSVPREFDTSVNVGSTPT
jgi:hypothetical protein